MEKRTLWIVTGIVGAVLLCCGGAAWVTYVAVREALDSLDGGGDGLAQVEDPRPARAVVRVVGDVGEPVADARVEAHLEPTYGDGLRQAIDPWEDPVPALVATTEADGSAVVEGLGLGDWMFVVRAPGRAAGFARTSGGHAARTSLRVRLGVARTLAGTVRDEEGRAVAGAVVLATSSSDRHFQPSTWLGGSRVRSGADGSFVLGDLASGVVSLWVLRPGDLPVEAGRAFLPACGRMDLTVPIQEPYAVEVVDPAGRGVAGAEFSVQFLAGNGVLRGRTGGDGRASVLRSRPRDEVGAAVFDVSLRAPGWSLAAHNGEDEIEPDGAAVPLVLEAGPGGTAEGVVRGPDGPVEGAEVSPDFPTDTFLDVAERSRSARTGPDGRFRLDGLPCGRYPLRASVAGLVPARGEATVDVAAGGVAAAEIVVVPDPTPRVSIRGRVLSEDGTPLDGASVAAIHVGEYDEEEPFAWTSSGPDGSFALDGIPAVAWMALRMNAEGHRQTTSSWGDAAWFAASADAGGVLERGTAIEGSLRTVDGAPLRDAIVWIYRLGADHETAFQPLSALWAGCPMWFEQAPVVPVAADGSFTTTWDHDPGRLVAYAWAEGCAPAVSEPFDLDLGAETVRVEVVLGQGVTLRRRVLGLDGRPLAGLPVRIRPPGFVRVWGAVCATTDAEGRFAVAGLPERDVVLDFGEPWSRSWRPVRLRPSAEESDLTLVPRAVRGGTAEEDE